ncbi:MAG TPA: hypothetical protein ENH85_01420 [Candidatus Scalindua sp.]|nr:hypothetical protein [Candidatus Scalindua sp.]
MKLHLNKGLFSNYYLEELLPKEAEFDIPLSELEGTLEGIKRVWDKKYFSSLNEPQLRKHFLDKVFETLGWTIDVEPPTPSGEWSKHPDYALFHTREDLKLAQKTTREKYFKKSLCIGEAKRWGRPLDKKLKEEKDPFEIQNPSLQISRYLWLTGVKWGILTDGKYWRLYERETSKRLDIFYEIDLENLIENGTIEDFKYFYLFFQRVAFPYFVEKVYKGSIDYAEAVGEELKENVYQALKILAEGFLKTPGNNLKVTHLKEIHDNSLIFLYRLLFILYAEYRGLLPIGENRLYTESYSLDALKKEVAGRLDRNEPIAASTHGYWNKLKELFEIINIGNSELGVPPYNGGLFDLDKHELLEKQRLGDLYIVNAIDFISRSSDKAYIDYGSLETRHLGSIYEGLLEYKLKISEEDIVPIKEKGKVLFIPLEKAKKIKKTIKEKEIVRKGKIYLVTDKGERKATGSYYTPDYIVKYIVENTLSPLIGKKKEKVVKKVQEVKEKVKKARGYNREALERELRKVEGSLLDEILSIKVLDPAMGSGHFLVEATDFLAMELLKVLSGEPIEDLPGEKVIKETIEPYYSKESEEEDIRWARREVVEKCIFGVDLNPLAVELAKLSLWLYTVAKNRPLNFLDHHLRCGNSLIGTKINVLATFPELKKKKIKSRHPQYGLFESIFKEKVSLLLGDFEQIERLPSDTVEQIRRKENLYRDFRNRVTRFQDVADVWTSIYFGNVLNLANYQTLQNKLRSPDEEWVSLGNESWFKRAKETAKEKRFFHWELEFPEIFFEGHKRKEDSGFDAVVGNPPYGILNKEIFFKSSYTFINPNWDIYVAFIERGLAFVKEDKYISYIVPLSWETGVMFEKMRTSLLECTRFKKIVNLPFDVFKDAYIDTGIFVLQKGEDRHNKTLLYEFPKKTKIENLDIIHYKEIDQILWKSNKMQILGDSDIIFLISKLSNNSFKLGDITDSVRGILATPEFISTKQQDGYYQFFDAEMYRYEILSPDKFIFYSDELPEKPSDIRFFKDPRILVRRLISRQDRIMAHYVDDFFINKKDIYIFKVNFDNYSPYYILTLINSKLLSFIYLNQEIISKKDDFRQSTLDGLRNLYIRKINFVTPIEKIALKAKEVIDLYNYSKINNILMWIERELSENRNDTIHNILAFLAEQMIEMNKAKQKEIKGFLEWLENQLKIQSDRKGNIGIETLTGKTQIKNYLGAYQKEEDNVYFKDFWNILEKNKGRIQANLKSRQLFETIKAEYEKSLSRLLPLKEKLSKTDWLIDQIVYKLYGLTEEEIKIIESKM